MPKELEIIQPFFPHDYNAQGDKQITLLIEDMGYEGYGLFWAIVEFLHRNDLEVGEERLIAGKVNAEKIKQILNNYKLFRVENNLYISDRVQRNKNIIKEKTNQNRDAASVRWLLSAYSTAYEKEFDTKPVLSQAEKNKLIEYSNQIEDFKQLIPKILKKLHKIKFTTDIGFKARSNWLLKDDNLAQIVNGQYGDLISEKNNSANKPISQSCEQEPQANFGVTQAELSELNSITSKAEAIRITRSKYNYFDYLPPDYKKLMKKFDVTKKEFNNAKI